MDGVGRLVSRKPLGEAHRLEFEMPGELGAFLVPKGSITIDGTSLTVNDVLPSGFTVTLIPHTGAQTTLLALSPGDAVNLEVDLIAKYVRRMLSGFLERGEVPTLAPKGLSYEQLARCGFLE
ncbi:Riboflavin synthase [compost metagenome]